MLLRAVILASALICGSALAVSLKGFQKNLHIWANFVISQDYSEPNCNGKQVIVHLFEWSWDAVANECEQYLGPKGFCGVQVNFDSLWKSWVFFQIFLLSIADLSPHGAYPGPCLVDALPACLLQASVEVGKPWPVRQHGQEMQRCGCQRHRRLSDKPHEVNIQIVT